MKLLHLADLHIGKIVQGYSMLEEQEYALDQILSVVDEEDIDVILISGDIYDRKIPPKEGVTLYNRFLAEAILRKGVKVLVIAGNHDSAERIEAGGELSEAVGYIVEGTFKTPVKRVTLEDELGEVDFFLVPFAEVSQMRLALEDESIRSFETAFEAVVASLERREGVRSVVLAHCYAVTSMEDSPEKVESQKPLSIGGNEYMMAKTFEGFTYAALGHLHRSQRVGSERIQYSGSMLKYSFSEENHEKSVSVVTLGGEGEVEVRKIPVRSRKNFRTIRGLFEELLAQAPDDPNSEDFLQFVLEDPELVPNAMQRLRKFYPNALLLTYPERQRRAEAQTRFVESRTLSTAEMFENFYEFKTGKALEPEQKAIVLELTENEEGGEE
jgi:exonuclease SbcD